MDSDREEALEKSKRLSRRLFLSAGLGGLGTAAAAYGAYVYFQKRVQEIVGAGIDVFKGDAPNDELWESWESHGWVREASYYRKLGRNVQCQLCPNSCVLEPGDRSHCRNRINRDGTLYTLTYGNPCSRNVDPIEKKPLYHYYQGALAFSFATSGCGFRCLNCQNHDISQAKPEETKDARGEPFRIPVERLFALTPDQLKRLTLFPREIVAAARAYACQTIAYTYSEPSVWFEYMLETSKLARQQDIKNVWVTCGYLQREPLLELCKYLDAVSINLKSFSDDVYRELNSGRLQPVLDTLLTLKQQGIWFEVINLVVPTYTDKPELIRPLCEWVADKLGPDVPLHFSRFNPQHKLLKLPVTPVDILLEARQIALAAGLHYVYIGNVPELTEGRDTHCPKCHAAVVEREYFRSYARKLKDGKCADCGTPIAGVWR